MELLHLETITFVQQGFTNNFYVDEAACELYAR